MQQMLGNYPARFSARLSVRRGYDVGGSGGGVIFRKSFIG
jgi:hypothetical protein